MSAHQAFATSKFGWEMHCPQCSITKQADSEEHADYLADEHYRDTDCTCWDSLSMEFAPTPCPTCQRTA